MKIAIASHSLVAERQHWFWKWFAKRYDEVSSLMMIAPRRWGVHSVSWGFPVTNSDNLAFYTFDSPALIELESFEPDIIYVQNEAYCQVTHQLQRMAKRIGSKFAIYVWENLMPYQNQLDQRLLHNTDLVICGNGEAESLVKPFNQNTLRCIQVGVNTEVFRPLGEMTTHDILYQGRQSAEKGVDVLKKAIEGTGWKVLWPQPNFGTPYEKLPERINKAKLIASPSLDTPRWKEQHAGYASLDALACGLYVATSDSSSIYEALKDCPGVAFSRRGDPDDLRKAIDTCLNWHDERITNKEGRQWVISNCGYEAIARKHMEAFRGLVN